MQPGKAVSSGLPTSPESVDGFDLEPGFTCKDYKGKKVIALSSEDFVGKSIKEVLRLVNLKNKANGDMFKLADSEYLAHVRANHDDIHVDSRESNNTQRFNILVFDDTEGESRKFTRKKLLKSSSGDFDNIIEYTKPVGDEMFEEGDLVFLVQK